MAKKSWSYNTGEKGRNRVRAFEDEKSGIILLEFYERAIGSAAPKRKRVSTGHRDRERAKREADQAAARFGEGAPLATAEFTLHTLFDNYLREVTPNKGESKQKHDHRCAEMFLRCFGARRKPSTLSLRDWDRFINERRRGSICPLNASPDRSVGNRVIAYDLKWLLSVLNWATIVRDEKGDRLLQDNPLKGLQLPKEENPCRPMLLEDRFERMLQAADKVDPRFRLALVLAHETGHRIGAIRQLRWSDVDLGRHRVVWRAEHDKIGREHTTPLSQAAVEALEAERRRDPRLGDAWIFPSPEDHSQPMSRFLARDWWARGEKVAGLQHESRVGWHSLRRKFATELKGTNLKDLCSLGGWTNPQTLLLCYQREDEQSMREALANRRPLRVAATGG